MFKRTTIIVICLAILTLPFLVHGEDIDAEVRALNEKIEAQKQQLQTLQDKQKKYQELINQKRQEQNTLKNQLELIDENLQKTALEVESSQLEVDKTETEIRKTNLDIRNKGDKIGTEKEHLANVIRLIYKQDQVSTLEMLLQNDSLTDFVNSMKYLQNTNDEILSSLETLKQNKADLDSSLALSTEKQATLIQLKNQLDNKLASLDNQKNDKSFILSKTQQSEKQYQALLAAAKKEQMQAEADIANMEKIAREKLAKKKQVLVMNVGGMVWPVPSHYITTSFQDPDYPFRRSIGEHPAIDIRATQGTSIRAAASGYVARVKFDGSRAYSYIMIIHGDGLSTVYGHVSGVSVSADQYVEQGQVIGRSGGLPGTIGSGGFSTGAHLHFEVRKDGLPVNPTNYLP